MGRLLVFVMERTALVVAFLLVFLIAVSTLLSSDTETEIETGIEPTDTGLEPGITTYVETPLTAVTYGSAAIKVPAVDSEGNGIVTWLKVDSNAGEGRTLVDINQLLFWIDTQYSIQISKMVAENYTGVDLSEIDLVYSIDIEASLIEGPSAGAALTVATIAAIQNKTLKPDVIITGTMNPDGSIGPVGGILVKAKAAKDIGATLFIVPKGQATQTYYKQERTCEKIGPMTYCTTEYVPETTDIEEQTAIRIEEVSNIGEALSYFIDV